MVHVVTRKEEELETLIKFIENLGEKFDYSLVDYSHNEPCDVAYKEVQYQITEGDQDQLEKKRRDIQKYGHYSTIRSIKELNDPKVIIEKALQKKVRKSSKSIILLINCPFFADHPQFERGQIFKNYISDHKDLSGLWKDIFLVFQDQNIELLGKERFKS